MTRGTDIGDEMGGRRERSMKRGRRRRETAAKGGGRALPKYGIFREKWKILKRKGIMEA
jgi:hypothetical protein